MRTGTYHTTKDGDRLLIAEMTDSHLLNTMRMLVRHLFEAYNIINNKDDSKIHNALYDTPLSKEEASDYFRRFDAHFPSYLFEANLRGLEIDDILVDIRTAYDRDKQLIRSSLPTLIEDQSETYDEEYDEYDD